MRVCPLFGRVSICRKRSRHDDPAAICVGPDAAGFFQPAQGYGESELAAPAQHRRLVQAKLRLVRGRGRARRPGSLPRREHHDPRDYEQPNVKQQKIRAANAPRIHLKRPRPLIDGKIRPAWLRDGCGSRVPNSAHGPDPPRRYPRSRRDGDRMRGERSGEKGRPPHGEVSPFGGSAGQRILWRAAAGAAAITRGHTFDET